MTQPQQEPTSTKPTPQEQAGSTGNDQAEGYKEEQGNYPAYSGRIAEATHDNDDEAQQPNNNKQPKPKP